MAHKSALFSLLNSSFHKNTSNAVYLPTSHVFLKSLKANNLLEIRFDLLYHLGAQIWQTNYLSHFPIRWSVGVNLCTPNIYYKFIMKWTSDKANTKTQLSPTKIISFHLPPAKTHTHTALLEFCLDSFLFAHILITLWKFCRHKTQKKSKILYSRIY